MRAIQQRRIRLFKLILMAFSLTAILSTTPAQAATPVMKRANVSWNLKKGKTATFYTAWSGVGLQKIQVKITSYKVKNSSKRGYKEAIIGMKFTNLFKPTEKQFNKIINSKHFKNDIYDPWGGWILYHIVDYNTGKTLLSGKKNVTLENVKDWKVTSRYNISFPKNPVWRTYDRTKTATRTIKITYPKKYKGLCFGLSGRSKLEYSIDEDGNKKSDYNYWDGKISFLKTYYQTVTKAKPVACFMKIS